MERFSIRQFQTHPELVAARLHLAGLSQREAAGKAEILADCARALASLGLVADTLPLAFYVPGRIELFGKHTDYAGGRSLVATVERGICALAVAHGDNRVRMIDVRGNGQVEFPMHADLAPAVGHWSNYPMTVARRLARNFPANLRGATIAFAGDLPQASGMSSSSALIVLTFSILANINRLAQCEDFRRNIGSAEALAGYLGTIENGQTFGTLVGDKGVGAFGGSEDHAAILCCEAGHFSQYSYCPVRRERVVAMPSGHVLAIAVSGVPAEKTGAARDRYNRIAHGTAAILRCWNAAAGREDPHLAAAIESSPDALPLLTRILRETATDGFAPQTLVNRLQQFAEESGRLVPAAGEVLFNGDSAALGPLSDRSQELAERFLENQTPETALLARSARQFGALAASAFGAGFGGSVWAMVHCDAAEDFLATWRSQYLDAFPRHAPTASFFLTRPGPPALELGTTFCGLDLL